MGNYIDSNANKVPYNDNKGVSATNHNHNNRKENSNIEHRKISSFNGILY